MTMTELRKQKRETISQMLVQSAQFELAGQAVMVQAAQVHALVLIADTLEAILEEAQID